VIDGDNAGITVSIGVASSSTVTANLPEWANLAKAQAKQRGRNRTVTTCDGEVFRDVASRC